MVYATTTEHRIAYEQASPSFGKTHSDDKYIWHKSENVTGYWINRDGHSYGINGARGHKDIAEVKWTFENKGILWKDGAAQQYLRNLGYIRVKIDSSADKLRFELPTNHHSMTKKQSKELHALALLHNMETAKDMPSQSGILRWRNLPDFNDIAA